MATSREIISLQFGHYSNYVGAHFWNVEELSFDYTGQKKTDIDHDVLYREGLTLDGKLTYTPRLLLADLKHSLKSFPLHGGLESCQVDEYLPEWHKTETLQEPKHKDSKFQQSVNSNNHDLLDDIDMSFDVRTWTDYLYPRFHQRTVNIVHEYKHNDVDVPFETFTAGCGVWKDDQFCEVLTENIRLYAEECDNFQGFNITLDSTDGFGGLASECLDYLSDQYSNKSVIAFPLTAAHFADYDYNNQKEREKCNQNDLNRLVNLMLTYEKLFEYASLFVPLQCRNGWKHSSVQRDFNNVSYNVKSNYETSSILASALNTLSLKYRLKNSKMRLSDLCADMSGYGRKMAAMSLGLPFYMKQKDYLIDHLDNLKHPLWTSLTLNSIIPSDKIFQHIMVRGIPESRLKRPLDTAESQLKLAAYKCTSVKEMFEFYFHCNCFVSATNVTTSPFGMEIKTPFPKLFSKDLDVNGFVKEFEDDVTAQSVPIISGLHNGNFLFDTLECLLREIKRVKQSKLQKFYRDGLEQEEFANALEKLDEVLSNYQDDLEL